MRKSLSCISKQRLGRERASNKPQLSSPDPQTNPNLGLPTNLNLDPQQTPTFKPRPQIGTQKGIDAKSRAKLEASKKARAANRGGMSLGTGIIIGKRNGSRT